MNFELDLWFRLLDNGWKVNLDRVESMSDGIEIGLREGSVNVSSGLSESIRIGLFI